MARSKIRIFNRVRGLEKKDIETYTEKILIKYNKKLKYINIVFFTRPEMLKINKKYLSKSTHTDIIAFDISDTGQELEGELYIGIDQIRENAVKYNQHIMNEIHRVIIHGILHLMGENDETDDQKSKMHLLEDEILKDVSRETW